MSLLRGGPVPGAQSRRRAGQRHRPRQIVVGPSVKRNFTSSVMYTHGSLVKTVEKIFGLPTLATVNASNTFADFFVAGTLP